MMPGRLPLAPPAPVPYQSSSPTVAEAMLNASESLSSGSTSPLPATSATVPLSCGIDFTETTPAIRAMALSRWSWRSAVLRPCAWRPAMRVFSPATWRRLAFSVATSVTAPSCAVWRAVWMAAEVSL